MFVVTSQDPGPLSNSYLVGDREGGQAVLIDAGTDTAAIHRAIAERGLTPTRLFITHRHPDHIQFAAEYVERYGIEVCGHRAEAQACGGFDRELDGGERFPCGDMDVRVLHIPGHTAGHIAIQVSHAQGQALFPADTLFHHSVGGTRGAGHTSFEDLRHSILNVLLGLPPDTVIYPGHSGPTTVAEESDHNPFVRAWQTATLPTPRRANFRGQAVELLLRGPDYDGGTKCWVRWPQTGQFDILPGSQVQD